MKEIPLTQGKVAIVDDQDYEELNQYKWCAFQARRTWYAMRKRRTAGPVSRRATLRMHAVIAGYGLTDHIDGNGLNNQRSNLREATPAQNQRNRRAVVGKSSRYKGVDYRKESTAWRAAIRYGGRQRYLGIFRCEEDAALAYDQAAREAFGSWATLNFPLPGERSALTGELVADAAA